MSDRPLYQILGLALNDDSSQHIAEVPIVPDVEVYPRWSTGIFEFDATLAGGFYGLSCVAGFPKLGLDADLHEADDLSQGYGELAVALVRPKPPISNEVAHVLLVHSKDQGCGLGAHRKLAQVHFAPGRSPGHGDEQRPGIRRDPGGGLLVLPGRRFAHLLQQSAPQLSHSHRRLPHFQPRNSVFTQEILYHFPARPERPQVPS